MLDESTLGSCQEVPVLSWSRISCEDGIADLLLALTSSHGIFVIEGAPVDAELMASTVATMRSFFELSLDEKVTRYSSVDRARRGYSPVLTENFASLVGIKGAANDCVEKFRIGPPLLCQRRDPSDDYFFGKAGRLHFFHNVPGQPTDALEKWYKVIESIAAHLVHLAELALELPCGSLTGSEAFQSKTHTSILSANYYGLRVEAEQETVLVAPHTDVSVLTIIAATGEGLEVCINPGGGPDDPPVFMPVPLDRPGPLLIVNVGDCFSGLALVQGRVHSTVHRVRSVAAADLDLAQARMSLAFFVAPRHDAVLGWVGDSDATYDIWRRRKIKRAMLQLKTTPR